MKIFQMKNEKHYYVAKVLTLSALIYQGRIQDFQKGGTQKFVTIFLQ